MGSRGYSYYEEAGKFPDIETLNKLYNETKSELKKDCFMVTFNEPLFPQVGRQYMMDGILYVYTTKGYTRGTDYPDFKTLQDAKKFQDELTKDNIELDENLKQLTTVSFGIVGLAVTCILISAFTLYGLYSFLKLIF